MRSVLKWIGIVLGATVIILVGVIAVLSFLGNQNLNRIHTRENVALTIPTDEASIERGKHLVHSVAACPSCHGASLEGDVFIDGMPIGVVVASNLTRGAGGIGSSYTDQDWAKALRYGLGPDGKALLPMMPSDSYHGLADVDLGAVIAYLKSVPALDNADLPQTALAFPGRIIMGVLSQGEFPANFLVDAPAPAATSPTDVSAEHGAYLVKLGSCVHCHGADLSGGQVDPEALPGPNLTQGGHLAEWGQEDFIAAMRSGVRPDGTVIDPFMPWTKYLGMNDEELESIWLYLQSLDPQDNALTSG